jgi:hypothetical protein
MIARYAIASRKRGVRLVAIVLRPTVALRCHMRTAPRGENSYASAIATS